MDDNIDVALTTTKHILAINKGSPNELQKLNAPICTAQMTAPSSKIDEKRMAQMCKDMAKTVYINPEQMTVYIGEGMHTQEGALVEYTETNSHEFTKEFFEQWKRLQMLMFEFVMLNSNNKPIFSLRGIWDKGKWHNLAIHHGSPALKVLKRYPSFWGTFSTHQFKKGVY